MSTGSQGTVAGAAMIPESLRAVLTTTQQLLLMDTVLLVSVNDLRRALCDAEFAERLVQRPEPQLPVQQRAFTPRAATVAELAAASEATRQAEERIRQRAESTVAAAVARRRAAETNRQGAADAERIRVANLREQIQRRSSPQRQPSGRRDAPGRGPQGFDAAIRNITQSEGHRPGHVPVLGGQASAREELLAQARANRVPIDWDSETMWRLHRSPRTVPSVRISSMPDQQLADEVDEVIANVIRVFQLYADENIVWSLLDARVVAVQAKRWLATQTAFRALVQEAVRRGVPLYGASVAYITQFVLEASSNAQLADFVNHPVRVVTEESVVDTFGRGGRALRLDDD